MMFYNPTGEKMINGTRRYRITTQGNKAYLVGGAGMVWEKAEAKADCLMGGSASMHLKRGGCSCGINIAKGDRAHNGSGPVIAEMIGWGQYVEGELGWRCEYGEIVAIHIEDASYADYKPLLEAAYPGVAVVVDGQV